MKKCEGLQHFWPAVAVLALGTGCSKADPEAPVEPLRRIEQRLEPGTFTLTLPAEIPLPRIALGANQQILLGDRTKLTSSDDPGVLANTGSGEVSIGAQAEVFGIHSAGTPVSLRSSSRVEGDVTTAGQVTAEGGVVVTGVTTQHASLQPPRAFSRDLEFPPSSGDIDLEPNQPPHVIHPESSYGAVQVKSGSTLELSTPGIFYFDSLGLEPQATLRTNGVPGEATILLVRNGFDFKGVLEHDGTPSDFFVGIFGAGTVSLERETDGTFWVPNGTLRLAPAHKQFTGSLIAKALQLEPDLTITFEAFDHWGFLLPPIPEVDCVSEKWEGHWVAKLSYENQLDEIVEIPVGPHNQPIPEPTNRPWPTEFQPGKHSFWTPFGGGTTFSWRLGTTEVVATPEVRRCTSEDYTAIKVFDGIIDPVSPSHPSAAALARQEPDEQSYVRLIPVSQSNTVPGPPAVGTLPGGSPAAQASSTGGAQTLQALGSLPVIIHLENIRHGQTRYCPLSVTVTVNGESRTNNLRGCGCSFAQGCLTDGNWPLDWAPAFDVPRGALAQVRIEIREDGSLRHAYDFTIDTSDGSRTGDLPECDFPRPNWSACWTERSDYQVPGPCVDWRAQFIDSGYGEGRSNSSEPQFMDAAHAYAALYRSDSPDPVWFGYLDRLGCIPEAERLFASQVAFPVEPATEPAVLSFVVRPQFCLYNPGNPTPKNEQDCLDLSASGQALSATVLRVPPALRSYDPETGQIGFIDDEDAKRAGSEIGELQADVDMRTALPPHSTYGGIIWPPPTIPIHFRTTGDDEVSRVSFVVSRMLSIPDSGFNTAGSLTLFANDSCPVADLEIAGDSCVTHEQNSVYIGTVRHTAAGPQDPRWAQSKWKYIIAHEVGHMLQNREHRGLPQNHYGFSASGDPVPHSDPGALFDPEETNPICTCSHVTSANRWHCLQSIEKSSAAQAEGFAHFVASKIWNRDDLPCVFNYYKEFAAPDCISEECELYVPEGDSQFAQLQKNIPPVAVSCDEPHLWRNNFCNDNPDFGTEIDWMAFFWRVNMTTLNRINMREIADIYKDAFTGNPGNDVGWEDFEGSAEVVLGVGQQLEHVVDSGNEAGVDLDTSRR